MDRPIGGVGLRAWFGCALAWCALVALAPRPSAQGWFQDERYGFKFLPPKGWKAIPLKAEENWLVAKFLCDEKDFYTSKEGGWTFDHQAELMVIAFVAEATKQKEKVTELGGKDGEEGKLIEFLNPYKDYEDFLDRTYAGGGFYVSEREEGTANGLSVTKLEVKVEKLATTGPKRILTWIFHAPEVDFAVQAELLEDVYAKRKSTVLGVLKSFKTIPRTMGPLPTEGKTDEGLFISISSMKKGSPEEHKQARLASERQLHARAKKSLPAGWQVKEHKRFLLVYDTDPGFVDKLADSADALLAWADENLGFIGPGEYVRRPILRVCDSREEKDSFQRGVRSSGSWSFSTDSELVSCKDEYGATGWQTDELNRDLLHLWMRDRDEELWFGMPEWIQHGLDEYVAGARGSGRKLTFKDYFTEMQAFREAAQQGKNVPVRELVQMSQADFYGVNGGSSGTWDRMAQADMLVRFLLSSECARAKQTKTLLFDYLRHVRDAVVELENQDVAEKPAAEPKTEEEEEEQYKKKHEAWGTSEREKAVLQRAFAGWNDKDWDAFEKAFLRFAG